MNSKGNIMIGMFFAVFALMLFIAILSPMNTMINIAKQSNNLNCAGYIDIDATASMNYSYNASVPSNELACVILNLYIPYIALGLLFYLGARMITRAPQEPMY